MASKKSRKSETPEQTLERWLAGAQKGRLGYSELIDAGWEAGQVGYIEVYGMKYEKFYLPDDSGYVVVEWDDGGTIGVC